ncbi:hypothetical protein [Amycolatopsis australiensis]|uniref:Uncharacterized protein n=1 Tax=Amycolatopsis australiensis TaxID=546364 RepID=A0A1K1LLN2_9PSEU|nr:hypothetical protein [Amycolatopsis australiensis]SFW11800.1 hypothetical protein SAMN04489730_0059 [Amycolatopsis australiensis]
MSWITMPVTTLTAAPVATTAVNMLRPRLARNPLRTAAVVVAAAVAATRLGFPLAGLDVDGLLPAITNQVLTAAAVLVSVAWLTSVAVRSYRTGRGRAARRPAHRIGTVYRSDDEFVADLGEVRSR